MNYKFEGAAYTNPGLVREGNEDYFLMPDTSVKALDSPQEKVCGIYEDGLFGVFDGMGGHKYGAQAARLAAISFLSTREKIKRTNDHDSRKEALKDTFLQASQEIKSQLGQGTTTGTTAGILYLRGQSFIAMNVGDSRIYHFSKGKLQQVSADHTLAELKYKMGIYEKTSASYQSDSHLLTQYLGQDHDKHPLRISIQEGIFETGDYFLLCTDGVYHLCDSLENILRQISDRGIPTKEGIRIITEEVWKKGADDNLTLILIKAT